MRNINPNDISAEGAELSEPEISSGQRTDDRHQSYMGSSIR